ncbi:type IV toxin-antitoxin system AbiEi family antitoxin domain-containing protein [Nocardioides houyundeii]|uniref:type IV toxin-antitoxin system AbiEi family antitoxin domain-containing protein n=1 Tax=Nocardioides houyundeii TaxID=2045452 RepID=UPI0013B35A4E|nr:type IV toxin-antitoxin system AbiEi family antitoxin domain-containing protein [Nocardioides houyundeii]
MDDLFSIRRHGVFLRRDALDLGYRDRDLVRARKERVLHRIRHGAYVDQSLWDSASAEERHRLHVQAVLLSHRPGSVAVSHCSAASLHELAMFRTPLDRVHLTMLGGASGRTTNDVVYHQGAIEDRDLVTVSDVLTVEPVRASLEVASSVGLEPGVVVLDSQLARPAGDLAATWAAFERMKHWPHTLRLQMMVRLARPGSMSVGETRVRLLCWRCRLPEPVLQHEVHDESGRLVGVSDFWWPRQCLLGEFDGAVKYGRYLRPGETAGGAVFREKRREDRMRELTGAGMIRFTWPDLATPEITARRLRTALALKAV